MLSARLGTIAIACLLTLGAATGTLGCKKLLRGSKDKTAGTTTSTASTNTPQDDVDEQMLDKLDAYIVCLNTLSSPVHQTRARYFSWVDPKKGVVRSEDLRHHQIDNLHVVDGSVFPTSLGVNPQMSIYGLSHLISERLAAKMKA